MNSHHNNSHLRKTSPDLQNSKHGSSFLHTSHKSFLQKPQRGHSFCKGIIRDVKYLSNHLKSVRRDIPANYQGGNHPSLNFHRFSVLKNSNFGQAILLPDGQMVII